MEGGVLKGLKVEVRFPLLRMRLQSPDSAVIGGGHLATGAWYLLTDGARRAYAVSTEVIVETPTRDSTLLGNATEVIPALLADWRPVSQVKIHSNLRFRRVRPNQVVFFEDGTTRPSSMVFKDQELSVNIESLMVEQGRPPEDTLTGYPDEYLTSVLAGHVRERGHPIVKDPGPKHDLAHGLVLGKKKDAFANAMIRLHQWLVAPPEK